MKSTLLFAALFAACATFAADAVDGDWNWYENETLPLGGKAFKDTATFFERWPASAKGKIPDPLVWMGRQTTGMYVRFVTDADKIRVEWKVTNERAQDPLIPQAGLIGIDVYGWDKSAEGGKGAWRFRGNKRYWGRDKDNPGVAQFGWRPGEPCIVFLPIRATMKSFRIGVPKGKEIKPHPYRVPDAKPIVHYGTSIVHGGCASRPGLAFTAIAARELDLPYVNLGFSGAAKMEASVPEFLAAADASLYVIDARWNMSPQMVATNCVPFLRKMKELKPDVPMLLCEGCTVNDGDPCNAAFRKAYDSLKSEDPVKWRNLYYFTEKTMLPKDDKEATHDFCHPNDYGMMHMGRAYARRIRDVLDAEAQARTDALVVDFDSPVGPVKPVNGVGQPPTIGWNDFHLFKYLKDAGIPYSRLHDTGGALGKNLYVDIPNLFRDFDADENDPASYDFTFTDGLMKALVANGVAPYFRLGITIENAVMTKPYRVFPPKDYAKWARICEHVIRHYNEGWANGFKMNVKRWEIWNEPENHPEPEKNPMWRGDWASYVELYRVAARHLKAKFPHLEIGGYGSCGFYAVDGSGKVVDGANASPRTMYFVDCFTNFIDIVKRENLPLDFFSMHSYAHPRAAKVQVKWARARLDEAGLAHVPISLNEWLPEPRIQRLGTPRQAALIAAQLANFQNGPVADAEIYDARCGLGAYSPLFDGIKRVPYRAYYVYVAFNVLRKLGTAVKAEGSADFLGDHDGLWAIAATNAKDYGALLVANPTDRAFRIPSAFGRWRIARQRAIDADHNLGDLAPDGTIGPDTVLLIEVSANKDK